MLQFRQCVTIWSCGLLYVVGEYGKSSVNCVDLLFQTIQNMSSDYQPVNPIAHLDVVTICLMDPGGDAWRVLGLRPHLTTSNHICLLLLYKQHTT